MPLQPSVQTSVRVQTLFFDMNSFFASVAQQEEPQLQGRPLGVLTTDAPGAACIAISVEVPQRGGHLWCVNLVGHIGLRD